MTMFGSQWFASSGDYEIDFSCRLDGTAFLSKTFGAAGNRKTWTQSLWIKRSGLTAHSYPAMNTDTSGNDGSIMYNDDKFEFIHDGSGAYRDTNMVFMDTSAWYHLVWFLDSTLSASEAVRSKLWVNGVEQTWTQTATIAEDKELQLNNNVLHGIGYNIYDENSFWNGYIAEYVFIDGTALTADSFGETNSTTGQWIPKNPSGLTFGTNGFWLDFANSSAMGNDVSGNDFDWATTNIAAGDQMKDSPTNNFCVLNGNTNYGGLDATLSEGNTAANYTGNYNWGTNLIGTIEVELGGADYVFEATYAASGTHPNAGFLGYCDARSVSMPTSADWYSYVHGINLDAAGRMGGSNPTYTYSNQEKDSGLGTFTNGDVMAAKLIGSTGVVEFYKGGDALVTSAEASGITALTADRPWVMTIGQASGGAQNVTWTLEFDLAKMSYSYGDAVELSMANVLNPTIADPSVYFQTTLYTGDGGTPNAIDQIENSTFLPDLLWIKNRDQADDHHLFDSIRGVTKTLSPGNTDAETTDAGILVSFDSDGFSVGSDGDVNTNTEKYVAWQWHTQGGSGSSNTDGSINTTSTSVNTTARLSISTYTGTGSNATVGHGLGVVPEMIIAHRRDSTGSYRFYHSNLTDASYTLNMESTGGEGVVAAVWNSTAPTSTVFSIGTNSEINASSGTYVAYCFAGVEGFSKFGSYMGNGAVDGPFIHCGFRPAYVMIKSMATEEWSIIDSMRDPYNNGSTSHNLIANANTAEANVSTRELDLLSNGFKIRHTNSAHNTSGQRYIYATFAETPFQTANAR